MLAYPKSSIGKRKVTTPGGGAFLLVEDNDLELPIKGESLGHVASEWSQVRRSERNRGRSVERGFQGPD